jgi:hypothetical protein
MTDWWDLGGDGCRMAEWRRSVMCGGGLERSGKLGGRDSLLIYINPSN